MSQEFISTESRILGAPSKVDEFLLNPQARTLAGAIPGTSRNNDTENREPTRDCYQNDPYPDVVFSACRSINSIDSDHEESSHKHDSGCWNEWQMTLLHHYNCLI